MSGAGDTLKRFGNWHLGKGFLTGREAKAQQAAKQQGKLDKIYGGAEMPDEDLIRRNERRKAAGRRGSRQRNVLTSDEDVLG